MKQHDEKTLRDALQRLIDGTATMSIPARPEHDPDIILSDAISRLAKLGGEVAKVRETEAAMARCIEAVAVALGTTGEALGHDPEALVGEAEEVRARLAKLEAVVEAAVRASAELRHAYRDPVIDRNLVARAIEILECATTAVTKEPTNG